MGASQQAGETSPANNAALRRRSLIGGSIGHFVEWYDWFAYSALALYFAPIFFPEGDQVAQLMGAAAIFAVGFLFRPVGAWIIGRFSDRHGRRAALTLCVALMGAGSLIIAVTPGYHVIGPLAPAALLLARIIQGISVGGESGASATYVTEVAEPHRRGFWASLSSVNLSMGQLFALIVLIVLQRFMPASILEDWGWRIAFFAGTAFAGVAFWLRVGIAESPSYVAAEKKAENATTDSRGSLKGLSKHWRSSLLVFGLTAGSAPMFYTFTSYLQKYLVTTSGFTREDATTVAAASLAVFILIQPIGGMISDRVGRKPLLLTFGLLGSVCAVPLFMALQSVSTPLQAFLIATAALVVMTCYTAISAVVKAELFPVEVRTLGAALPFALAQAVISGTVEYVALSLKQAGHENWYYWYVAGCAAIFFIVALLTPETAPGKQAKARPQPAPA